MSCKDETSTNVYQYFAFTARNTYSPKYYQIVLLKHDSRQHEFSKSFRRIECRTWPYHYILVAAGLGVHMLKRLVCVALLSRNTRPANAVVWSTLFFSYRKLSSSFFPKDVFRERRDGSGPLLTSCYTQQNFAKHQLLIRFYASRKVDNLTCCRNRYGYGWKLVTLNKASSRTQEFTLHQKRSK